MNKLELELLIEKDKKEKQKETVKEFKKLFARIMKMIGLLGMTVFAVLGAIIYYVTQIPENGIIANIIMSVFVISVLWLMVAVEEN